MKFNEINFCSASFLSKIIIYRKVFMKLSKTSKVILSISLVGWFLFLFLLLQTDIVVAKESKEKTNLYKKIQLFNEVLFKLQENYVDDLDAETLIDAAIEGMLDKADPHTVYFTAEEFDRFNTDTKGEFSGLGISIDKKGDYITVVSPIEGTPAYRLGIQAGDKIVRVDGDYVVGMSTDAVISIMRGEKGTKVVIGIERPGIEKELEFEIIREIIKVKSVPYAYKMDNGVGYIKIRQFSSTTTKELREQLNDLEEQGIRGLIIDLRYNPGGLLSEAVNTVNEFIGPDKRVVFTKGKTEDSNNEYITRYDRIRDDYPIVVLINGSSASASEIFAGSLQDWDRGLVVGTTSFGKGSVQRLFPLTDGNGIKITTAKYYINSGRCIHKDLNDTLLKDKRVINGEMSNEEFNKLQQEADDENHEHIYYTSNGRIVYGGGGITPDIEIKQSRLTDLAVDIRRKNLVFDYTVNYMIEHDKEVDLNFKADDDLVTNFFSYVSEKGIEFTEVQADSTISWIRASLTSNIIEKEFGTEASYKVIIQEDNQLQKALELFDNLSDMDEMFNYAIEVQKEIDNEKENVNE